MVSFPYQRFKHLNYYMVYQSKACYFHIPFVIQITGNIEGNFIHVKMHLLVFPVLINYHKSLNTIWMSSSF